MNGKSQGYWLFKFRTRCKPSVSRLAGEIIHTQSYRKQHRDTLGLLWRFSQTRSKRDLTAVERELRRLRVFPSTLASGNSEALQRAISALRKEHL